ncbi:MAG: Lpg1974 family pore-forming outer membrane protein, partial [Rhodospirillales bacterium]
MHTIFKRSVLLGSTALVGALAAFATAPAQAQMYTTGPGTYLSVEGRYLWGVGDKAKNYFYDYAGGTSSYNFDPYDTSKSAADKGFGGKVMLGYRFGNNWDVGLGVGGGWLKGKDSTFSYNESRREVEVDALVAAPNALTDHIKTTLNYVAVDFEAGYNMPIGGMSNFRVFGGVRFAYLSQKAKGSVDHALFGSTYFDYSGQRKTTFTGVGPRIGANAVLAIGSSGFNVFGGASGALLIGRYKDQRKFDFLGTNGSDGDYSYNDRSKTKIIPNVEGEIGVGYNFGGSTKVGLQIGYRGEAFFGAATKGHVIGPYDKEPSKGDYLIHGPFARLTVAFGAPAPMPAAVPPPAPAAMAAKSFIVFFDFDRSN